MKDLKEAQKLPANKKCADCTAKVRIAALLREARISLFIQRELPASYLFLTRALGCRHPRPRLLHLAGNVRLKLIDSLPYAYSIVTSFRSMQILP